MQRRSRMLPESSREMTTNRLPTTTKDPTAALSLRPPEARRPRLGELLIRKGYINEGQLSRALEEAYVGNELLGVTLLRKKLIFEPELATTLSEQLAIPYINIKQV